MSSTAGKIEGLGRGLAYVLTELTRQGGSRKRTITGVSPCGENRYRVVSVLYKDSKPTTVTFHRVISLSEDNPEVCEELRRAGLDNDVVLSIPRSECLMKVLRVPSSDLNQIATMMAYEASGHLPWPPEDSVWGYRILDTDEEGYTRLLLSMIERRIVELHLDDLKSIGIEPTYVETAAISLSRIVRSSGDKVRPALLFVDHDEVTYVRLHKGDHGYSRGVKSGETLSEMLQKSLEVDSRQHGPRGRCTSLILANGNVSRVELPPIAGNVPVYSLHELQLPGLNGLGDFEPEEALCLGAALANGELTITGNLLPEREKRAIHLRGVFRTGLASGALLLWFIVIMLGFVYLAYAHEVSRAERAKGAIADLGDAVITLKEKSETLNLLADERRNVSIPLAVVLELYERTPPSIAITSLRYDSRGPLVFGGEAPSFQLIYAYLDALLESKMLENVEMNYGSKPHEGGSDSYVDFKVSCFVGSHD